MKSSSKYYFLLGGFLVIILSISYFFRNSSKKPTFILPIYGPETNGKKVVKSGHRIPSFSFIDQDGEVVSEKDIENKIAVIDYFFTTCQSICPIMSTQMERIANEFSNDPQLIILSHTVDPETDTVEVLRKYASLHAANSKQWKFLTGKKEDLYSLARKGYLLDAQEGNGGEEDFIHTQNFALIDTKRRIRGFYDGTDSVEVSKLIRDIKILKQESY